MKNSKFCFSIISFVLALSAMLASVFSLDSAQLNISGSLGYSSSSNDNTATALNKTMIKDQPDLYTIYKNVGSQNDMTSFWVSIKKLTIINTTNLDDIIERMEGKVAVDQYIVVAEDSLYSYADGKRTVKYKQTPQIVDGNLEFSLEYPTIAKDMENMGLQLLVLNIGNYNFEICDPIDPIDFETKEIKFSCSSMPFIGLLVVDEPNA